MRVEMTKLRAHQLVKMKQFLKKQPPVSGKRTQDVIRQASGKTYAVNCTSAKQAFNSFITQVMIDFLVNMNREARRKTNEWNREHSDVQRNQIPVNDTEMTAFVGVNLLAGLHKSNREPILSLRSERKTDQFALQLCRGIDLLTFENIFGLQFDDRATREERRATDKLTAFRDFCASFQAQL